MEQVPKCLPLVTAGRHHFIVFSAIHITIIITILNRLDLLYLKEASILGLEDPDFLFIYINVFQKP